MNEERWHNFAKEKPSEDMEGRNFIVSNGHYEKIATWCGYWENEPFMGDHLCDEVVRWKFYFTPEEEKANETTHTEQKPMKCDELKRLNGFGNFDKFGGYYDADEVDAAIAELKARIQLDDDEMAGFLQLEEECGGGDLRNYIEELKRKLEDAKATAYTESVDAGIRERRLRSAFYKACANWAQSEIRRRFGGYPHEGNGWFKMKTKCLKKAEEYGNA